MTRIGLISDTHGFLDEQVFKYFEACNEIWHAGDFGSLELAEKLSSFKPLKGVYGNIDSPETRNIYPEDIFFQCEDVKVFMTHIGGYPPKYNSRTKPLIKKLKPKLFICGHSHILKVMYDKDLECLHMNPGAAGKQGYHIVRTLLRFVIDGQDIKDCEVIELGKR
ncbi:MAG: metallophosphoesterase family protein [Chitinophagaceae bacterium]